MKHILYLFLFIGLFQQLQAQDTIPEAIASEPIPQNVSRITGGTPSPTIINLGIKSASFAYSGTKNTETTKNYCGRSSNDILYKFTLFIPMEIIASHCGSEINDTYMTLLDDYLNFIVSVDDYGGEGHCSNTYHAYLKLKLPAGTYYIVSEGYNSNGNITTHISGTPTITGNIPVSSVSLNTTSLSLTAINQTAQLTATIDPPEATNQSVTWSSSNTSIATVSSNGLVTALAVGQATITVTTQNSRTATCTVNVSDFSSGIIDTGTKSGNFTYTDTKNTANTGNNYTGRSPNDVLYKFTLSIPMEITATHCGSALSDTYMTLLDASENVITYNDDYSGEGKCSNTYHSVISRQLPAGTYYIVSEGYSGNGNITTTITGTVINNSISVTGVSLDQASLSMNDGTTAQLTATVSPSNATNRNVNWSTSHPYVASVSATGLITALSAGQATITVKTADGNKTASCTVNVTAPTVIDIGTKTENFTYTDTKNTANTGNTYTARTPNDVLYKFTLSGPMEITATHCGSELSDTYMTLLDASRNVITYNDDYSGEGWCTNTYHSVIKRQLAAGTYYIVSEGYSQNGNITTNITGTTATATYAYSADGAGGTLSGGTAAGNYPAGTTITLPTGATRTGYNFAGFTCPSLWSGTKNQGGTFSMPAAGITVTATWMPATVSVTGVSLNQTSLSMNINTTAQLTATVAPSNASNRNVSWTSSNTAVATVSSTGLVTATARGTATITVTTADGNRTATCNLTVTRPIEPYTKATPVAANPSAGQNYIRTRTYTSENSTYYLDAVQYYDGLGRPSQTVQTGITPNQYDLVALQEYDNFGRESNAWLPAAVSGNNGAFVTGNLQDMSRSTHDDQNPFARPEYEPSPLNRVNRQFGPGASWHTGGKSVNTEYLTNSGTYPCAYYYMDGNNLKRNNDYGDGQLFVTKTTDEEGNISYEFKDKLGRILLQRQMNDSDPHDTYYVYDDFNNLRYVLPPMVAASNYNEDSETIKNYAYVYKYDYRNRCIYKKLPGCEAIFYVYDKADRLIFSQDGEQQLRNEWLFNKYDAFGRVILTGIYTDSRTQAQLAEAFKNTLVVESFPGGNYGYTWNVQPIVTPDKILTVNHYDDYQHLPGQSPYFSQVLSYETKPGYGTMSGSGKGLLVGTRIRLTDGSGEIVTAMYYDARGHLIQQKSTNHLGGLDKEYYACSFTGQVEKKLHEHSAPGKPTRTEIYGYDYDHAERLVRTRYTLNTDPEVLMNKNEYDELGRLKTTTPYSWDNFKSTYAYTIRSWTSRIAGTHYTEDLIYRYNGNVANMQWVQGGATRNYAFTYDGLSRIKEANFTGPSSENYTTAYGYDKNGNLTSLTRGTQDSLTFNNNSTNQLYNITDSRANSASNSVYEFKNYSTVTDQEYRYNANGAMTKDLNKGVLDITYNVLNLPLKVDILSPVAEARNEYLYSVGGQKLRVVRRWNSNYSASPVVGTNTTLDASHLNSQKTTDYVGNIIYEDDALKMILTENGYYDGENYYFYVKNHLGSNVMTVREDGSIVQNNHYYPFGLTMGGSDNQGVQPYKYTGKELDMEHGLMQYDYEARQYDPAVGRFTTMDPLAEKYPWLSPYAYCGNNPLKYVDPDGRDIILRNVFRTNNRGYYDARRGGVSGKTQAALSDLMKTTEVKNFFGQFAKKGDKIGDYTFTENGSLSNKTLELYDYSFEEGYNSNLPLSREGEITVDKDKGTVTVDIFSYGESKENIGEIVTHETQLHGYSVKNELEGKPTTSADKDHKALKSKDKSHIGYKKYDSTRQQLKKIDLSYEKSFEEAEKHATRNY